MQVEVEQNGVKRIYTADENGVIELDVPQNAEIDMLVCRKDVDIDLQGFDIEKDVTVTKLKKDCPCSFKAPCVYGN